MKSGRTSDAVAITGLASCGLSLPSARRECTHIIQGREDMRIVIDLNRCQGYAQCVTLAPDVLQLSGEEALMYDPNPDDTLRLRVLRAAASCPVQAIIVDQLDELEGQKP